MIRKIQKICVQAHTKVFRYIASYGGKCLKRILTNLYSTEYNKINISYSDVQNYTSYKNVIKSKNVLYTCSCKRILEYYGQ